ncbi:tRNA threonylcarbamoyladenosine dehydratase [Cecembia calidifontis]|jgi:tRNA A37 threonylcarbamoyladenosine dehydratase|uniref:tRNA A37 threonylcarbamoyladenosine dehydratase n=1 Tax=Cecembia calidifontis TaxID=1187080 RepID=A0A4Q7P6J6_9BACT|nr:tRNA threonylcarbamoyladenosine dehydratase [Cecembia calidifontis]RZS95614.1 tRNA A37 threonylcarbamoyladenosine dehydratase [Cecembia calidifontis]
MNDFAWLSRTELITGREGLEKLAKKHVLIVGLGGVGSFAAEFICRSGIGEMTIIDGDVVDISNCNRQLPATQKNVGQSKAEWMEERLLSINPKLKIHVIKEFLRPEPMTQLLAENEFDYVVDCIDSFTPKLHLIEGAYRRGFPLVSSMGAGGKVDPTQIRIADISKTYNCKLARMVRKRLKKRNIFKGFKAVFSTELYIKESLMLTDGRNFKKSAYGTMSFLPAAFGCSCASVVVNDLLSGN